MDFTVTIADTIVPRIVTALGFTGTAAQKKAQAEAWLKAQIKANVVAYESAQAQQTAAASGNAEVW